MLFFLCAFLTYAIHVCANVCVCLCIWMLGDSGKGNAISLYALYAHSIHWMKLFGSISFMFWRRVGTEKKKLRLSECIGFFIVADEERKRRHWKKTTTRATTATHSFIFALKIKSEYLRCEIRATHPNLWNLKLDSINIWYVTHFRFVTFFCWHKNEDEKNELYTQWQCYNISLFFIS